MLILFLIAYFNICLAWIKKTIFGQIPGKYIAAKFVIFFRIACGKLYGKRNFLFKYNFLYSLADLFIWLILSGGVWNKIWTSAMVESETNELNIRSSGPPTGG